MCNDTPSRDTVLYADTVSVTEREARRRERAAYSAGRDDSDDGVVRNGYVDRRYPAYPPKMVTRPRVEVFADSEWRVCDGQQQVRSIDLWVYLSAGPALRNKADAERWLNLWNNPTETVPTTD